MTTVVALQANRRSGTASVKTKATVNGSAPSPGARKARAAPAPVTSRAPCGRAAASVFGPHPRDYSKKVAKGVKRIALRKALSERIKAAEVLVVDSFAIDKRRRSKFAAALAKITDEPKTLVVSAAFDSNTYLAARNVQPTLLITAAEVNTEQLLNFRKIVITNDGPRPNRRSPRQVT
jgi:large subunit ribosomal protein L4